MATYQFSALSDGQSISFSPTADRLHFDQSAIAAGDIRVTAVGSNVLVTYVSTGKEVTLLNVAPNQLATSNITFASATLALFGDNSPGTTNDAGANSLTGTSGRDLLMGLGGNDTLGGGAGSDVLIGGGGNDSIGGGTNGDDWLEGGFGNDRLAGGSGRDSFAFREAGTSNADTITDFVTNWDSLHLDGSALSGLGTNGRFASGDARFHSAAGATTAHDADDRIIYNSSTGQLFYDADGIGGASAQLIANLGAGRALVASDFNVFNASSANVITGTDEDDELRGTEANDIINALGGNDDIETAGGQDTVDGGTGFDSLSIGFSSDVTADFRTGLASTATESVQFTNIERFWTGSGHDRLTGNDSGVVFYAYDGNDTLTGGGGDDQLYDDLPGTDSSSVGHGNDQLFGGGGADYLWISLGDDTVDGGAGDDHIILDGWEEIGEYGNDVIDGGTGIDLLEVMFGGFFGDRDITIDLTNGTITGGSQVASDGALVSNVENVLARGGSANANLIGSAAANRLEGGFGEDTLVGREGQDTLIGGAGPNSFVFDRAPGAANADLILDFGSESGDTLVLDKTVFSAIGATGDFAFNDARYAANSTGSAQEADDRIVFNRTTGELWYDADGNGSGAALLIAILDPASAPGLIASDITVAGNADPAPIVGTEGNDTLVGTLGNDTIYGLGGDDFIDGSEGDDLIDGGAGNDEIEGSGGHDTVLGGAGNDILTGTHVSGGDGNDVLNFETLHGFDTLDGGAGDDIFYVNADDVLIDSGGTDTVITNESWTLAAGFEHLSFVNFTLRDDGLPGLEGYGNELANRMRTYAGDSGLLDGRDGNDTLIGGLRGADTLIGSAGNDVLTGDAGGDSFMFTVAPGGANADQITDFTSGSDKIVLDGAVHAGSGPSGDLDAGDARFWSSGTGSAHDADDRVIYNTATGQLWYDADGNGSGAAQLIATLQGTPVMNASDITIINGSVAGSVINGTASNDTLSGTSGDDTISGLGGNDLIQEGNGGNDVVDGGAGSDSIEFKAAATSALVVDFATGSITGSGGSIAFTSIERVVAGNFNDSLSGAVGGQNLAGQAGADTLWGAAGADTLWGGTGNDAFIFREMGAANADRVSDFASGQDKLQLDDSAFTAIGAIGNFAAGDGRFWAAAGASSGHDANDRVIYNTSTGALYYDADGSGSGAAQLVATLTTIPNVTANDISVI